MEKKQLSGSPDISANDYETETSFRVVFGSSVKLRYLDAPPDKAQKIIVIGDDKDKQLPDGGQLVNPHTPLAHALLGHDFTQGNTVSFEVINAAHQHRPISVEVVAIDGQTLAG